MKRKLINVAIIGCGVVGLRRKYFIEKNKFYSLVAVSDIKFRKKLAIKKNIYFYKFYGDLFKKKNLDAVFITLPNYLAARVTISSLKKNIHVFCEKPPAKTLSEIKAVKKIIYAESSAVYEGSSFFPTPEEDENPESFYAVSKMAGKLFADAYIRFSELNLISLRYFNVYGPRQDYRRSIPPLMCALIMKLLKGEQPVIFGNGEKRRDFVCASFCSNFLMIFF